MSSKKKKSRKKKAAREVALERRDVLDNHISMLVPTPITNSGRADGGWMDRTGISQAGLGHQFLLSMNPIDCFYSNQAYAAPGFTTLHLELHPVLGIHTTKDSLLQYLREYLQETENDFYRQGEYRTIHEDVPQFIEDPATALASPATLIVQTAFEVPITPSPSLPTGLTATTYAALLYFGNNRGIVLFKANNFHRHRPPLDYHTILASITYKDAPSRPGDNANLRESAGAGIARMQCRRGEPSEYCMACGRDKAPNGGPLKRCSKCRLAHYCCGECQKKDWKRHKQFDCVRQDEK